MVMGRAVTEGGSAALPAITCPRRCRLFARFSGAGSYVLSAAGGTAHAKAMSEIAESARNIIFLGHTNNSGHGDCVQVMVSRGHAYMGTRTSRGVAVTDVLDPRAPRPVNWLPVHPNSWCLHLQTAEDLLLVIEELDLKALLSIKEYYSQSNQVDSRRYGTRGQDFSAGMRVYDIKDPANPRSIGFMEVEGLGLHRIWWNGGRYAYASALLDGYTDHILLVIDMRDPTRPVEAGRWWVPGMHAAAGETPSWTDRVALHHAVIADGVAYERHSTDSGWCISKQRGLVRYSKKQGIQLT
jgi:hypothetical protein